MPRRVENLWTGVVEERMVGTRIPEELDIDTGAAKLGLERIDLLAGVRPVLLGEVTEDGALDLGHIRLWPPR